MQKESIVSTNGQQAFTNSLIVAKGCPTERKNKQSGEITLHDRDHRDVLKLVKQYQAEFEEFNPLRFETALGKKLPQGGYGQETEYAILSEDQATYLITLFTNTAIVRKFKRDLVKAFRKALEEINRLYANPPRNAILTDKRQAHHPMMTALIEMREKLGKETDKNHFICENKLCNAIVTGKFKTIDESALSNEDVKLLALVRRRNQSLLDAEIPYDERKKRLNEYAIRQRTKLICG